MFRNTIILCVSVALVQTVYGQCINSYVTQPQILTSDGGCGNNILVSNNAINTGYGSVLSPGLSQSDGLLSIASGSYTTPNGISIIADNLELIGNIGISGSVPFIGSIGLNGALPSGGQATVQYSSAPGVGIINAGCGQGLNEISIGAPGLSSSFLSNNAIFSNNQLNAGNLAGLGFSVGGCGC